jgi:hypothetical protein
MFFVFLGLPGAIYQYFDVPVTIFNILLLLVYICVCVECVFVDRYSLLLSCNLFSVSFPICEQYVCMDLWILSIVPNSE